MNLRLYNKLMESGPQQHPPEWKLFLEFCSTYLKKHKILYPIVVELGTSFGMQKKFYTQLFGAQYIGIDITDKRSTPDIQGDTHDLKTIEKLKRKLNGKAINILFIDAGHNYESVKKDFEMYSSLCDDIVAIHDIATYRYRNKKERGVAKLWDELKEVAYTETGKYENYLFISIQQCREKKKKDRRMGIGVIIKNGF